ncbi:hypothetical protein LTR85_008850 [Meristemomyces frigidus]|nr:hypothetical protein LTR85_008850 [Meristemomyces frigidus]
MSSKYPSREEIAALFGNMETGDYPALFERISPNVDWTVMGTHPCAGRYTTLKDFQDDTMVRLGKIMKEPGICLKVRNVIGGGDQEWATVELVADAECKSGLKFDNTYAWCMRFDEAGRVVEVRAYLDSWMVKQAIEENECPSRRAPMPNLE